MKIIRGSHAGAKCEIELTENNEIRPTELNNYTYIQCVLSIGVRRVTRMIMPSHCIVSVCSALRILCINQARRVLLPQLPVVQDWEPLFAHFTTIRGRNNCLPTEQR